MLHIVHKHFIQSSLNGRKAGGSELASRLRAATAAAGGLAPSHNRQTITRRRDKNISQTNNAKNVSCSLYYYLFVTFFVIQGKCPVVCYLCQNMFKCPV